MSGLEQRLPAATAGRTTSHDAGLSSAEKYERVAFTFCKMGTTGLLAWALTPPVFVLLVAIAAVGFYGRALSLGLTSSRCVLRKPALIIGFWTSVGVLDALWLLGRL